MARSRYLEQMTRERDDVIVWEEDGKTHLFLNMGPSHPAMHGIIKIILELDGEYVVDADIEIGYLHRAFEKTCEYKTWNQVIPYTDRLNYVSPLINNVAYVMTVEKLLGIEVPRRAQYIRVLMSEISRLTDHLTCIGAALMELGAMTAFLYMIKAREWLWELIEMVCGARLTTSYTRVGGLKADLPDGFAPACRERLRGVRQVLKEIHGMITGNRIFLDRMRDVGVIDADTAISYGFTGPCLRACGVPFDLRKDQPYLVYDELDFDVPIGEVGDNLDRYLVRMEEMEQSIRIIAQCLERIPEEEPVVMAQEFRAWELDDIGRTGRLSFDPDRVRVRLANTLEGAEAMHWDHINVPDRTVVLPPREETYTTIESLMNHFKLIMNGHGIRPPAGEVYHAEEGANGELGFYIVSTGEDHPYRIRVRGPCFALTSGLVEMIRGHTVADIVPIFGSINMIGGELER